MCGRGHRDRRAAIPAGLALALASSIPSLASEPVAPTAAQLRTVLFGSLEAGRTSFATLGLKHALAGPLDRSGPALMATAGYGGRFERDVARPEAPASFRHAVQGGLLPGYQWMLGWGALGAFVGPELDYEAIPNGQTDRARAPRVGARVQGEAWLHPTSDSLLTATVIAGTARSSLWSRAAAGYRLWRGVFVGPEASFYGADLYREWRLGAHATGFALGRTEVRVSAGWRQDNETKRGGAYVGLAGHIPLASP